MDWRDPRVQEHCDSVLYALSYADSLLMDIDIYEGVYYCVLCGMGLHISQIVVEGECRECGGRGFVSERDFNLEEIL